MKLVHSSFEKDKSGSVSLVAQDKEDLWTLYNLIGKDDEVRLKTIRNVKKSPSDKPTRKLLSLSLSVENVDFTPSDEVMRIKGRTTVQHDDVPLGSYHTAELEFNQKFTLYKNDWDEISLDLVNKSCSIEAKAEVGAVVLQEGVAHLCLITENMTILRSKIEKSIPKKRRGDSSAHDKQLDKFMEAAAESLIRNFNIEKLQVIVLVSPGFSARQLYDKLFSIATTTQNKPLVQAKSKFVVAHSSTGYLQGLEEALKSPELQKQLSDTKFQRNVMLFDEFSKLLNDDDGKAWYGEAEVTKAVELQGAVRTLMVTDSLFKSDDLAQRKKYVSLTEQVKENGGEVVVFSSLHDSGEQLNQLTGVAVILNYPVPNLDDDEDDE
ncbi:hypothetical protein OGAPHI_001626 [Ogataea philodendri]|uniref:Protein DOM34 homolog n=1 Tax=Ogataea philodendri TaxID=1378263 RepID=A0A9P8PDB8_9ASCO|nr:uncharacterized protein OGAPHI_001626 [Ogataea philodendri]KAH3669505.1 hypothetical protein OGAPHI_001626 [Ogataea philodendri]